MTEWPTEGGRYIRNPDGSLTKIVEAEEQTVETPTPAGETDETEADAANSTVKVK